MFFVCFFVCGDSPGVFIWNLAEKIGKQNYTTEIRRKQWIVCPCLCVGTLPNGSRCNICT